MGKVGLDSDDPNVWEVCDHVSEVKKDYGGMEKSVVGRRRDSSTD